MKLLKNEKTPLLRNYLTLPLQLNADPDDKLLVATEGRVPSFSHDFVPNMLRTKPEPDVEKRHLTLEAKMAQINSDTAQVGFIVWVLNSFAPDDLLSRHGHISLLRDYILSCHDLSL